MIPLIKTMNFAQRVSKKWNNLSKAEKSGFKVLTIFVLGILIFSIGIGIGEAFYSIFGN
jgi:hypothetical protein